jgi:uncharacterized protein YndB with AHSA1/START domain
VSGPAAGAGAQGVPAEAERADGVPARSDIDRGVETTRPGALGSGRWVRVRRVLDASVERVYRAWADPEEMATWFPHAVEGSLLPGARTILVWPDQRVAVDVLDADPYARFRFRWSWLEDAAFATEVTVTLERHGYGTRVTLEDGPFDIARLRVIDAYAEALEGWGEAIANLRAQLDFAVDLRRME